MLHFFRHFTGLDNPGGDWYLFWSGFGGDIGLLGGILIFYKRLNCHVSGCWRLGLHHVEGTPYTTCRKHHPALPYRKISAMHVRKAHNKSKGSQDVKSH